MDRPDRNKAELGPLLNKKAKRIANKPIKKGNVIRVVGHTTEYEVTHVCKETGLIRGRMVGYKPSMPITYNHEDVEVLD